MGLILIVMCGQFQTSSPSYFGSFWAVAFFSWGKQTSRGPQMTTSSFCGHSLFQELWEGEKLGLGHVFWSLDKALPEAGLTNHYSFLINPAWFWPSMLFTTSGFPLRRHDSLCTFLRLPTELQPLLFEALVRGMYYLRSLSASSPHFIFYFK